MRRVTALSSSAIVAGVAAAWLLGPPAPSIAAEASALVVDQDLIIDTATGFTAPTVPIQSHLETVDGQSQFVLESDGVQVAQGATLRFRGPNPVVIRSTADVTVDGTLTVSATSTSPGPGGGAGAPPSTGLGGPGGLGNGGGGGGGYGGDQSATGEPGPGPRGGPGGGPGCGGEGGRGFVSESGLDGQNVDCSSGRGAGGGGGGAGGGLMGGDTSTGLFFGGSGGGGGAAPVAGVGGTGGYGGGGLRIASPTAITVSGSLLADGTNGMPGRQPGAAGGGAGGGGVLLLNAPLVVIDGHASAVGGQLGGQSGGAAGAGGRGGDGYIRVNATCTDFLGSVTPGPVMDRIPSAMVIQDDQITTAEDSPVTVAAPGVLANDCGRGLTLTGVSNPAHGTATGTSDGALTYTPDPNFHGTDSFGYTVTTSYGGTGSATVHVTVTAVDDAAAYVLQPIDRDGSSTFSVKRGVIPVKFELLDNGAPTCNLPQATIRLSRLDGTDPGTIDESVYLQPADTGNTFRVSDCHYIYNLAAKQLSPGTYEAVIMIDNSPVGTARFSLT